jgi:hypothetical protein
VAEAKVCVLAVAEVRVVSTGLGSRQRRRRSPAVVLPAATALDLDRLGFDLLVGWRRPVNLVFRAAGPPCPL